MASSVKKQPKKRMSRAARREAISGYLYLLPNFIGFFIFTAIPIILGLLISFTDYNGFKWNFVGLHNYIKMFGDSQFKAALVNNLIYSLVSVPLTIAFSLILALALNRKLFGGGFFKTVFFFPNLTSMVAIGCIAMLLFQPVESPRLGFFPRASPPAGRRPRQPGTARHRHCPGASSQMVHVHKNSAFNGYHRRCVEAGRLLHDHVHGRA